MLDMGTEQREPEGDTVRESLVTQTRKPWWKRKRYTIPLGVVAGLLVLGSILPPQEVTPTVNPSPTAPPAEAPPAIPPAEAPPAVPPAEAPPAVPPAPLPPPPAQPQSGSPEWLLSSLRADDVGFARLSDEDLISLADQSCDYREANGASGQAIKRIALESGFTERQAESFTARTYVYCTRQNG